MVEKVQRVSVTHRVSGSFGFAQDDSFVVSQARAEKQIKLCPLKHYFLHRILKFLLVRRSCKNSIAHLCRPALKRKMTCNVDIFLSCSSSALRLSRFASSVLRRSGFRPGQTLQTYA